MPFSHQHRRRPVAQLAAAGEALRAAAPTIPPPPDGPGNPTVFDPNADADADGPADPGSLDAGVVRRVAEKLAADAEKLADADERAAGQVAVGVQTFRFLELAEDVHLANLGLEDDEDNLVALRDPKTGNLFVAKAPPPDPLLGPGEHGDRPGDEA